MSVLHLYMDKPTKHKIQLKQWVPIDYQKWLSNVDFQAMTFFQRGVLLTLLLHEARDGSLPASRSTLAKQIGLRTDRLGQFLDAYPHIFVVLVDNCNLLCSDDLYLNSLKSPLYQNQSETEQKTENRAVESKPNKLIPEAEKTKAISVSGTVNQNLSKQSKTQTPSPNSIAKLLVTELDEQANTLAQLWISLHPNEELDLPHAKQVLAGDSYAELIEDINWLPLSNYWDKTGEGMLKGLAGFISARIPIRTARLKYQAKQIKSEAEPVQDTDASLDPGPTLYLNWFADDENILPEFEQEYADYLVASEQWEKRRVWFDSNGKVKPEFETVFNQWLQEQDVEIPVSCFELEDD